MKVGVIGAGTMGQGIAKAFAQVEGCLLYTSDMFIDCKKTEVIMDGELQKQYAPDNNSYGGDVAAGEIIVKYTYETVSNPATTVIVSYTIDVTGNIKVDVDYTGVKGLPELPVFGMRFIMPTLADKYMYKGLSGETYPDRKAGAEKGIYEVSDLSLTPYPVSYTHLFSASSKKDS